ncbi:heat shock protein DnaJ domain-containing protein [Calothrix parasitica NIES-267]|uniref:Heat shock protein DnaJ domain-containing protein n=1 Tax=Calothrix parasitica NIES-267 TaxID=1973488 RepID=A0A1Z4LSS8_9CYAN|nr:heat shock protein DnaJ domain-containing protein [Calothrix parasitica NIES-267]
MRELERYYRILDLEPGASLEEVNQAYRDLAFIWHPDRIPQEKHRLQEKARKKLQEINEAREKLRSIKAKYRSGPGNSASYQPKKNPAPERQYKTEWPSSPYQPKKTTTPKSSSSSSSKSNSYAPYEQKWTPKSTPNQTYQPPQQSDLSGQDFRRANLKGRDLSGRNLSYAKLNGANLSDAFMHKIILRGADLSNANLFRANLLLADMKEANLQGADLIGADLSGADLRGADLRGARIRSGDRLLVKLIGANLSGAIMPDGSIHK